MTKNKLNNKVDAEHSEIESLIPWYVNGTLSDTESSAVQRHIAVCGLCKSEVSRCQGLFERPTTVEIWQPTASHFAGIWANVEQLEAAAKQPDLNRTQAKPKFFHLIGAWFSQTPRPVRWALAFETLAFAALAVFVLLPQAPAPKLEGVFETLSNTGVSASTKGSSIRLMLSGDMTTQELFGLLKQAKAQIRQGPSEVGIVTIEVPTDEKDHSLGILHSNPKVRLAQPVEQPVNLQ